MRYAVLMTENNAQECQHGMEDPMWCSICRKALGFVAGEDRHANDCTVIAIVNLTGASYSEALEALAVEGRKPGKGAFAVQTISALASFGFVATPSALRLEVVIGRKDGATYFVSARRGGKVGHAFAIVNGEPINAGQFVRPGTSYRIFQVK